MKLTQTLKSLDYLTGVRGLAAAIVLIGHISNTGSHVMGLDLQRTAKAGVWLFFVLSAFLLTKKLIDEFEVGPKGEALARYVIRRVCRIMPTYLAFLGALWMLSLIDSMTVLDHALLLRGDDHLWTIPVEMQFYVLLPIFAFALSLLRKDWRFGAAAALAALSFVPYFVADPAQIARNSIYLANYLPLFAAGIALAFSSGTSRVVGWVGLASLLVLTPRSLILMTGMSFDEALEWSWTFAIAWSLVIYGGRSGLLSRILTARPLVFLGNISFSLYLVHFPIIIWIAGSTPPGFVTGLLMLSGSVAAAMILYLAVEAPSRKFGHWLTRGKRSQQPV